MRHWMRLLSLWLIFSAFLFPATLSLAQGDDLTVTSYNISGKQVIVAHPSQRNQFSGNPEMLRTALTRAEAIYERLFGPTPMKIFAEFVKTQHPRGADVLGEAGKLTVDVPAPGTNRRNSETVCSITIYNVPGNRSDTSLAITVAHEFVHCYQGFLMREDPPLLGKKERAWWIEGSAEWLAQKVYPELDVSPEVNAWQSTFINNLGESLMNENYSYDAMYFWHALERHTNITRAMEFLKQLLRNPDNAVEVLERLPDVNSVFATYGRLMAHGAIPYQPSPSRLYKADFTQVVDALPTALSLPSDTYAFTPYLIKITAPNVSGIAVKITGQTANDEAAYSPYTLSQVADGETISFCGVTEFPLIISRGKFKIDGGSDSLQVEITGFNCTPGAPPPSCLVGDWKLVSWPGISNPSEGRVISFGDSGISITNSGFHTFRFDGLRVEFNAPDNRKVQVQIDGAVYAGTIAFVDLGSGRYKFAGGQAKLIGTPRAEMRIVGIGRQDFSDILRQFLPSSAASGGADVTFVCVSPTTMEYRANAAGQTIVYRYAK
jgi:hypothetical protein